MSNAMTCIMCEVEIRKRSSGMINIAFGKRETLASIPRERMEMNGCQMSFAGWYPKRNSEGKAQGLLLFLLESRALGKIHWSAEPEEQ